MKKTSEENPLERIESYPDGEYNRPVQINVTDDGIVIDEFVIVPWEWIDNARIRLGHNES